jgi:hypothetical protein
MGEYLAAAKCIVGEAVVNEMPVPLVDGVNYLCFSTPEEAVVACQRLLNDPELARRMRQANYEFYQQESKPSSKMWKILNEYVV